MKLLFDFLPILLFFVTFRFAESNSVWATQLANHQLAPLLPGGTVPAEQVPVLLATLVVIVATLGQVTWLKLRGKRVDTMLWVSLALVVVLGGLTIWLRNDTFIKWKPTGLYAAMALAFWVSPWLFGKNLLKSLLGAQFEAPEWVWKRLNLAWILFFLTMAALNLWVAYNFSTEAWVNWKLFGGIGLLLAFSIGQALWLGRYLKDDDAADEASKEASK